MADPYGFPGAVPISGNATGANGNTTAILPGTNGKFTYICGFTVGGLGATAASVVTCTITNLLGGFTFFISVPAGVTVPVQPLIWIFPQPIRSVNLGDTLGVTAGAFGAGNTSEYVTAWGFTAP